MKKKGLLLATGVGAVLGASYLGVGYYFYNLALNRKAKKDVLDEEFVRKNILDESGVVEENLAVATGARYIARQEDLDFYLAHQPVSRNVQSRDDKNLKLFAEEYRNEEAGSRWAIVVHGYMNQSQVMVRWVRGFYEMNFNVLAPDLRGHGKSEGEQIGMGWVDRMDLLAWIDELLKNDPEAEIVLFGLSMGAATVMMAAGEGLPANVKVIVEDCGYSSVKEIFAHQLDELYQLPEFPVLNAANTVIKREIGYDIEDASAVQMVAKSKTPMLFIHGEEDDFVPFNMMEPLYQAANVEKEKLVVPGARHAESVLVAPELYWKTVRDFVGRFIPGSILTPTK